MITWLPYFANGCRSENLYVHSSPFFANRLQKWESARELRVLKITLNDYKRAHTRVEAVAEVKAFKSTLEDFRRGYDGCALKGPPHIWGLNLWLAGDPIFKKGFGVYSYVYYHSSWPLNASVLGTLGLGLAPHWCPRNHKSLCFLFLCKQRRQINV